MWTDGRSSEYTSVNTVTFSFGSNMLAWYPEPSPKRASRRRRDSMQQTVPTERCFLSVELKIASVTAGIPCSNTEGARSRTLIDWKMRRDRWNEYFSRNSLEVTSEFIPDLVTCEAISTVHTLAESSWPSILQLLCDMWRFSSIIIDRWRHYFAEGTESLSWLSKHQQCAS